MLSVALIWDAEAEIPEIVTAVPDTARVAPLRLLPLRATATAPPAGPLAGAMAVNSGDGGTTLKVSPSLVPPEVTTVIT